MRLSDDYDTVQEIDLIHMVEAEKDVRDFPSTKPADQTESVI
ncbi:MAG: hypothetical protein ACRDN8_01250 [Thermoleophilaceae bacterium]